MPAEMAFVFPQFGCASGSRHFVGRVVRASACAVLFAAGSSTDCSAQSNVQTAEYKVKAAFLYKFISYVEWPARVFARADSPLVIGVIGTDTLGDELAEAVTDRTVNGRPVVVRKLQRGETVTELHILFIGRSEGVRVANALASTKGKAVLTVTESEDAFALGSVINLVVVENKVRFDVALQAAQQANLKISSRLLGLARKVIP